MPQMSMKLADGIMRTLKGAEKQAQMLLPTKKVKVLRLATQALHLEGGSGREDLREFQINVNIGCPRHLHEVA